MSIRYQLISCYQSDFCRIRIFYYGTQSDRGGSRIVDSRRGPARTITKKCATARRTSADSPFSFQTPLPSSVRSLPHTIFVLTYCGAPAAGFHFGTVRRRSLSSYLSRIAPGAAISSLFCWGRERMTAVCSCGSAGLSFCF